jgi:hypothetical protein
MNRRHKSCLLAVIVCCLAWCGCASHAAITPVRVEPVSFGHPDEIVKGASAQVIADRRVFAVMAFLNAFGYDAEAEGEEMVPVRVAVRNMIAANLAGKPRALKAWRTYYEGRKLAVHCYLDYAVSLNSDFPFRRIRPDSELGYFITAAALADFPDTLNAFWVGANLADVWSKVKPEYLSDIARYDLERMDRQMSSLWSYLRMKRADSYVLANIPNLLDCHYHAIGARYENYFYSIESPGSSGYGLNCHEYLHTVINPLVEKWYPSFQAKLSAYYAAGRTMPLCQSYQNPVTFAYECLVRALDQRIRMAEAGNPERAAQSAARIAWETDGGLLLAKPFFDLLETYGQASEPFDVYLPKMFTALAEYQRTIDDGVE